MSTVTKREKKKKKTETRQNICSPAADFLQGGIGRPSSVVWLVEGDLSGLCVFSNETWTRFFVQSKGTRQPLVKAGSLFKCVFWCLFQVLSHFFVCFNCFAVAHARNLRGNKREHGAFSTLHFHRPLTLQPLDRSASGGFVPEPPNHGPPTVGQAALRQVG